jgi:hypothetical protein
MGSTTNTLALARNVEDYGPGYDRSDWSVVVLFRPRSWHRINCPRRWRSSNRPRASVADLMSRGRHPPIQH